MTKAPETTGPLRRCQVGVFVQAESVAYMGQGVYCIRMDGANLSESTMYWKRLTATQHTIRRKSVAGPQCPVGSAVHWKL